MLGMRETPLIDGDGLWEELDGTPALLAVERSSVLPEIVHKREHDRLSTRT
jgi:hypothetical protein